MRKFGAGLAAVLAVSLGVPGVAGAEPDEEGHYYGVIMHAFKRGGDSVVTAINYPSFEAARAGADEKCAEEGVPQCVQVAAFRDECGAVASVVGYRSHGGSGATIEEAEADARERLIGLIGHRYEHRIEILKSICTPSDPEQD
ncbi:DUF4189 domain-containing protein [Nocardia camponoti]|uniref:DUF4189 domain-containing protein n=1 Tax=Nocardia camponoti TaxID=1616106 RepID=A0A917QH69_9NOCA|nr:DUF4189 domain-containing protein [Nocardia camponoti]GGK50511.1 hypothetical protein GCM10011591_22560 [Nocardia camponoti]